MRIILIGCSKSKIKTADPSQTFMPEELYTGALFHKRVAYATQTQCRWWVLSAAYGLWNPASNPKPIYDNTMRNLSPADRAAWHVSVASELVSELWIMGSEDKPMRPRDLAVEIHAGKDYSQPLSDILQSLGFRVELPCEGLGIGEQLALYTSCLASMSA